MLSCNGRWTLRREGQVNKTTKIYFDGGCRPNPGVIETAVVIGGIADIRWDAGHGDNEDAEWSALLHAIERARAAGLSDVVLIGDSLSVIRQADGSQRGRQSWLDRIRTEVAGFERLRFRHVGRKQNLAGIALERARRGY